MLKEPNGWRRQLAQRLLVERQAKEAVPELRELLNSRDESGIKDRATATDFGRLHALWTLDGLGELKVPEVIGSLQDPNEYVRSAAVQLAARFVRDHDSLMEVLSGVAADEHAQVRFELALTLGETDDPNATELLANLARRDGSDDLLATAILTSAKSRSGALLRSVLTQSEKLEHSHAHLIRELASVVGARGNQQELAEVLELLGNEKQSGAWWQNAVLSGLAAGLPRHQGNLGRVTLSSLLAKPPAGLADAVVPVQALIARTAEIAADDKNSVSDRISAIELLGYQEFGQAAETFTNLLALDQPVEVQLAAIGAMQKSGNEGVADIVLKRWPELGPEVRQAAFGLLLRRTSSTLRTLEAMASGSFNPAIVDIDQRVRLLKHSDPRIKSLAEKLFGGAVSTNRREVAEKYASALTMPASASDGIQVFNRICAKCHRIDGRGFEVGPDISDVRNRSREALLYDILDPNQKLEPRFTDYLVITEDGRTFNGLMISESAEAVVLLQPEGKQQIIARRDIEELRASGKSLMPEGVEKDISVQEMAHLLEYLKKREILATDGSEKQ